VCGLAGLLSAEAPVGRETLAAMGQALAHRGPDGEGFYQSPDRRLGFVHRRLAIIDLTTGQQPLSNEDGTVVVVLNGEIYNYRELTRELEDKGHRFRTKSDCEVLCHLYEEEGIDAVKRLRGMFAFALWDSSARLLVLGRDRLGKKPLVYASAGGVFAFASELGALVAGLGALDLSMPALDAYLSLGYVPSPLTIYHQAHKLPPAHLAVLKPGGAPTLIRYWEPSFEPKLKIGARDAARELEERVADSVRLRLVSDVPVGLFLSGGVDFSVVGSAMVRAADTGVQSFTIGFDDAEFDESGPARDVARVLGTDHHEFRVRPDALAVLDEVVKAYGEPFADSSALPTYWLARETRSFVKVVLTGDGGDELFAGYNRYRQLRLLSFLEGAAPEGVWRWLSHAPVPRRMRRVAEALALPEDRRALELVAIFSPARKRLLTGGRVTPDLGEETIVRAYGEKPLSLIERLLYTDLVTYLPGDLLAKMDIATMAWGVEARAPLLDHELVSWVSRLPPGLKLRGARSKRLLKLAFQDRFPRGFLDRPKRGFSLPIGRWLREGLNAEVRRALDAPALKDLDIFDLDYARRMVDEHQQGVADHQHRLWALLVLGRWLELRPVGRSVVPA